MNLKVSRNYLQNYLNFYYKYIPKINAKDQGGQKDPNAVVKKSNLSKEEVNNQWYKNFGKFWFPFVT